jgi:acyl dehydratase
MTTTIPTEPGTALEPITRGPISRSQIARFAAATGDFNPIHTD